MQILNFLLLFLVSSVSRLQFVSQAAQVSPCCHWSLVTPALRILRLQGGIDGDYDEDYPTLTAARDILISRRKEEDESEEAYSDEEYLADRNSISDWSFAHGSGEGLWKDRDFLSLHNFQTGLTIEFLRDAQHMSFSFQCTNKGEVRVYLGNDAGFVFTPSLSARNLVDDDKVKKVPILELQGFQEEKRMTFGSWIFELETDDTEKRWRNIAVRNAGGSGDDEIFLRPEGFVFTSARSLKAMIVEYSRIEWVSMGTVTEYLLQDDLMFAHRHQSEGGREEEEKEENQEEEEERNEIGDLLQDGRSGLKGYDGELEPLHEIVERENEKIRNQPDHEDPLMNEILQEQMPWIREGIQEEKEENPNLDFSKFGQYFSQPSTSFLHPTKGATPLQPTPYHDPTSCNQFGYENVTLQDLVNMKLRQREKERETIRRSASLLVQGGYAKNESDARNLLASQYNATLDQLVYVLEMIDNRFVGDVVEGFQLLERRRQAYLEYDDDDIDQTLLGVGKFNEMCQHLDADYMNKLQKRINETERTSPLQWSELNETAIWKKPTADVMPYAYHSGLIISNEQLVEWERKRKERDERLSSSLLKQAAAFLKAGDGEAALPLQDSEHHAPMLLESQPQDEFNLTVAVGEGGEQYQSSLFYQKINNSLASNAISGRLDTQVKLMQALVEESHKNRRLAARLSKISPDNVGIIESLRPPRNQTEEEEETDLSALDEEIERLESELAKLRMDVDAPKASKTRVKKFNVGERNHEARKGEDVDVVGQMKAKIEQKKAIGDHLSLPMILKKDKEAAGLGNINDLLQGLQTKPSTSENIWTPDIIPKFFANATNGKSDDEIDGKIALDQALKNAMNMLESISSRPPTAIASNSSVKPEWLQPADLTGLQDSDNETVGEGGDEEQEWDGDLLWTMGKQEDPDANDDFPAVLMENDDTATYGGGGQPCRTQGDEMVVVKEAGSLAGEDWSRSMSAQEVWDIAQGRGQRGNGYTILRNRIYGTIIELYHDSDDGFFRFLPGSALPRDRTDKGEPMWRGEYTRTIFSCARWGDFWPRLGFMAHMLVRFIIENKDRSKVCYPLDKSTAAGLWTISPQGAVMKVSWALDAHRSITHKSRGLLFLTPDGFIHFGERSIVQVCRGEDPRRIPRYALQTPFELTAQGREYFEYELQSRLDWYLNDDEAEQLSICWGKGGSKELVTLKRRPTTIRPVRRFNQYFDAMHHVPINISHL